MGVLKQGRGRMGAMHQNNLETMAMAQVTQLTGKVHIRWKRERMYIRILSFLDTGAAAGPADYSQDTSTTVAGAAWVSAKRRRLCLSLSSAAFLAVALMWATVT